MTSPTTAPRLVTIRFSHFCEKGRWACDRAGLDYGSELDLQLLAKFEKYVLTLKYADYNADSFATDTSKLWVSVDYVF